MPVTYDPALIALSILIAIQGAYVSLRLASGARAASALAGSVRGKALLAASACALGAGIWSMHFVGMLALDLPVTITYETLTTLVSVLVSVLVTGIAVYIVSFGPLTWLRLGAAALFMGSGIAAMHYLGMSAVRANCLIAYSPPLVAASVVVGCLASFLGLWLAFSVRKAWHTVAGALAVGLAISGMHYTAMAAATFLPLDVLLDISTPVISRDLLAIVVAVATFVICGFFLLLALPGRSGGERELDAAEQAAERRANGRPALVALPDPEPGHEPGQAAAQQPEGPRRLSRLPVEKGNTVLLLDPAEVYSIQADEHYTRVFDGKAVYFCNRSISELETQLDPAWFLRVHRSHIVNLRHAQGLRRHREQGAILLGGGPAGGEERTVPVSRKNLPRVREALGI